MCGGLRAIGIERTSPPSKKRKIGTVAVSGEI